MDLDNWIETLKRCECLKEENVKTLCEKATEILVERDWNIYFLIVKVVLKVSRLVGEKKTKQNRENSG
jgi:predicted FMN-binding regulatory protein PaiB